MEFDTLLERRRSLRAYKADCGITKDEVEKMLNAALMAPSWKNSETGRYYVVIDEEKKAELRAKCLPPFNAKNSENASAFIVTAFETGNAGFGPEGPVNDMGDMWGAYDLGLQNQNLIMKASDLGYDTLIMGIRDEAALKSMLGIPDSQQVASVIAVGKRDKDPAAPKRKEITEIAKFF